MKLGLLGYPIDHSLSPKLYQELLGEKLESYEMFSCETKDKIPTLSFFANRLDGLNITSPYKTHFLDEAILSDEVRELGAINTLAFHEGLTYATNTDFLAVKTILKNYQTKYSTISIILLGDGAMAKITKVASQTLGIPLIQYSRKLTKEFGFLDLRPHSNERSQTIIINSCSRGFHFKGIFSGKEIFWDHNYSFLPHQATIPSQVQLYQDGQELLRLQAIEAINFWSFYGPKLK